MNAGSTCATVDISTVAVRFEVAIVGFFAADSSDEVANAAVGGTALVVMLVLVDSPGAPVVHADSNARTAPSDKRLRLEDIPSSAKCDDYGTSRTRTRCRAILSGAPPRIVDNCCVPIVRITSRNNVVADLI